MRYIPYILIVLLVLAGGLLTGAFLLGGPAAPMGDANAAIYYRWTTTTVPLATRVAALEKRVAALEATVNCTTPTTTTASTTTTTQAPTTTTKPPTTTTAVPAVLSVKDFGAKGDGRADDTLAFESCMQAAASAGKAVYIPAGNYVLLACDVPSGTTMRGDGKTSILRNKYDAGYSGTTLKVWNASDVSLSNLALVGNNTGALGNGDIGIHLINAHRVAVDSCHFTGQFFGIMAGGADSNPVANTALTMTRCTSDNNAHTILYCSWMTGLTISDCVFGSYAGDASGTSHQIYLCHDVNTVSIIDTELVGGSNFALHMYDEQASYRSWGNISGVRVERLKLTDVAAGVVIWGPDDRGSYHDITLKNIYGRSSRYNQEGWFNVSYAKGVMVDGFDLDGSGGWCGIAYSRGLASGDAVFKNGSMSKCSSEYYNYTPRGFKTFTGSAITSTNNTITSL